VLGGIWTGGVFAQQFARTGASAFSVNFEREAHYVGAYYAARAGYGLAGAEEIWRAFSFENPDDIRIGRTHPITPKQRRNASLVPEFNTPLAEANPIDDSQ
jgi:predicted Zn-dependent protease